MKKLILVPLIAIAAIGFFSGFHTQEAYADGLSYTVQEGDSLSSIAQAKLGDASKWIDIYNLNKDTITDPSVIYPGMQIVLPGVTTNTTPSVVLLAGEDFSAPTLSQDVTEAAVPTVTQTPVTQASLPVQPKGNYTAVIVAAAAKYNVSASVMTNVLECESGMNPNAYNVSSGATGIAQFMPSTYAGSWNIYKTQYPLTSPIGQIYAMALKISEGDAKAWQCYDKLY